VAQRRSGAGASASRYPTANERSSTDSRTRAGLAVFDCWIANSDRHNGNIAYSRNNLPIAAFDHERALLGHEAGKGIARLQDINGKPHFMGCLLPFLRAAKDIRTWIDRFAAIPEEMLQELCRAVQLPGGITQDEAAAAARFLCDRKKALLQVVEAGKQHLPNVKDW